MNSKALSQYFNECSSVKSTLGHFDCVRFVIEGILVGWEKDFTPFLGYKDRRSAVDRLRIAGGLDEAFTAEFGEPLKPTELIPGDVAYFPEAVVGLVLPDYVAVKLRGSIGRIPLRFVEKGWRLWDNC